MLTNKASKYHIDKPDALTFSAGIDKTPHPHIAIDLEHSSLAPSYSYPNIAHTKRKICKQYISS